MVLLWLIFGFASLSFSVGLKGIEECQVSCSNTSCCETNLGVFKCCQYLNGVCCIGKNTCCPQGSRCSFNGILCEYPSGVVAARVLLGPNQQKPPSDPLKPFDQKKDVICPDRISVCSANSTCCSIGNEMFGCCSLPNGVCCEDNLHCCPEHTKCNLNRGSCDPVDVWRLTASNEPTVPLWPQLTTPRASVSALIPGAPVDVLRMSYDGVQCSDSLECPLRTTCCRNTTGQFACCPMPDAVCCSDGEHCCPTGFRCDLSSQRCEKDVPVLPKADVECPDKSFHCNSTSTCCPLLNQEWACCPFEKAVCCSDMLHCCPENTTCDVAGGQCVKTSAMVMQRLNSESHSKRVTCSSGLVSCLGGTCCKNIFGIDACCPHPEAVCCNNGHCCPKGTRCDGSTDSCLPSTSVPTPLTPNASSREPINLCPDGKSVCPKDKTCCHLIDDSFGCCPLANGTCCADRRHCCPAGSVCTGTGSCVQEVTPPSSVANIKAERMVDVPDNVLLEAPRHILPRVNNGAQFCGLCASEQLCCPDAAGLPNKKCCPAPGRVCCPDGEHCCPKGTTCMAGGLCAPFDHHLEYSSSVLLSPSKLLGQRKAQFLEPRFTESEHWPALMASRARINVLYLLPNYHRMYSGQYTLCRDRMRYCGLTEKCCVSVQHGYVCVPSDATCCYPSLDTWCPSGSYCSDGRSCKKQPDAN